MCVVVKYPILIGFCIAMLKHEINNLKVKKNNSGRESKISVCSGLKRAVEVWEERLSWEHDLPGIMWLNSGKSGEEKSAGGTVTFQGMPSKSYFLHNFLLLHRTGYKAGTTAIFYIKLNVQNYSLAWNMSKANFNCVALFGFFFSFKMIGSYLFISI